MIKNALLKLILFSLFLPLTSQVFAMEIKEKIQPEAIDEIIYSGVTHSMIEKGFLFQEALKTMNEERASDQLIPSDIKILIFRPLWQLMIIPIEVDHIGVFHKIIRDGGINIIFDLKNIDYPKFSHDNYDEKLSLKTLIFEGVGNFGDHVVRYGGAKTDFSYNFFAHAPNLESITFHYKLFFCLEAILSSDPNFFENIPKNCTVNIVYPNRCHLWYIEIFNSELKRLRELERLRIRTDHINFVHMDVYATVLGIEELS